MIPGHLSYAPAADGWIVVAHDRLVSILDPSTSPDTVARLWLAIIAPEVSVESYVASIPLFGPDSVPSFAVAVVDDFGLKAGIAAAGLTVVVRGSAVVHISSPGGTRIVDDQDAQPWYLAQFATVTAFALAGASAVGDLGAAGARLLPLSGAVVDATFVAWTAVRTDAIDAVDGRDDLDDTVLGRGVGRRTGANAFDDAADGVTVLPDRLVRQAAPPSAPGSASREFRPDEPFPPLDRVTAIHSFRIGVGEAYPLDRPARVGRKPSPPRVPSRPTPRLVSVGSPRQEVSSSHVELRQEGSEVVVTDLRSTNGTVVSMPERPRLKLRQGDSVVVVDGTLIDIGDGNVIEILSAR